LTKLEEILLGPFHIIKECFEPTIGGYFFHWLSQKPCGFFTVISKLEFPVHRRLVAYLAQSAGVPVPLSHHSLVNGALGREQQVNINLNIFPKSDFFIL